MVYERASMLRYTYIVCLVIRTRQTISAFRLPKASLQVPDAGRQSQIAAESVQKEEETIIQYYENMNSEEFLWVLQNRESTALRLYQNQM
jgi:hypothetical protein